MRSLTRPLLTLCLAAIGCDPPREALPPPAPAPPKVAVPVDPCAGLSDWDREPSSIDLDGSARGTLVASCARSRFKRSVHVVATSPDLSMFRPVGFFSVDLDLRVPDPAAAFATLPPIDDTTYFTLHCAADRRIGAALILEKLSRSPHASGPCLPFEIGQSPWFGKKQWSIHPRERISRDDFDLILAFARTHETRITLRASQTGWAESLAPLALPPTVLRVRCEEDDATVDVASLAKLDVLEELTLDGPCHLQLPASAKPASAKPASAKPAASAKSAASAKPVAASSSTGTKPPAGPQAAPAPFARLRTVTWDARDTTVDLRGIGVFASAATVWIRGKSISGAADLASLPRLTELGLSGALDKEPPGKKLPALTKLTVSHPPPAFIADLPALAELSLAECAPVKNPTVSGLRCTSSAAQQPASPSSAQLPTSPQDPPGRLDLRGLPGLKSLDIHGPCVWVASPSLTSLSCTLEKAVPFQDAGALKDLVVLLSPGADLTSLAQIRKLATLSIESRSPERVSLFSLRGATNLTTLRLVQGCFTGVDDLYPLPNLVTVESPRLVQLPAGATRPTLLERGHDTCPPPAVAQ